MRFASALSLAMIPAALVAQAPETLAQRFEKEAPAVNGLIKEFKAKDAMAKAEALIPAQRPVFTLAKPDSFNEGRAAIYLYRLWANTAVSAGQWEKAKEIQTQRLEAAKALQADLLKAIGPVEEVWTKAVTEGKDYIGKNAARKFELEKKVAPVREEIAEINAGKKKKPTDKKELEAFNARLAEAQKTDQEIQQITAALKVHQDNIANAQKVLPTFNELKNDAAKEVKDGETALAQVAEKITVQKGEIDKFNTELTEKYKKAKQKKTVVGNKDWVDAVINGKESITGLATPQDQVGFVNRLLVLDAGNAKAQKVLDNVVAGKDPFFVEKPAKKSGKKSK